MANRGINKVILIGHLGQDPEVRYMPNNGAVANITLATSESWRDKHTGEMKEKTEWHRVVFFGKLAEVAGEFLKKGSQVYVEGMLQTRKWQDQGGQDRYTTEVIVKVGGTMHMLGSKQNSNIINAADKIQNDNNRIKKSNKFLNDSDNSSNTSEFKSHIPKNNTPEINSESSIDFDDDIPF